MALFPPVKKKNYFLEYSNTHDREIEVLYDYRIGELTTLLSGIEIKGGHFWG